MHSNLSSTTYYVNLDTPYLSASPFSPVPMGIFQRLNDINAKYFFFYSDYHLSGTN